MRTKEREKRIKKEKEKKKKEEEMRTKEDEKRIKKEKEQAQKAKEQVKEGAEKQAAGLEQSRMRSWLYHLMPKNRTAASDELLNQTVPELLERMMPVSNFVCPEWSSNSTQRDEWVTIHGSCAATHDSSGNENTKYDASAPCRICINGKEQEECIEAEFEASQAKNKWLLNEYKSRHLTRRGPRAQRREATRLGEEAKPRRRRRRRRRRS